MRHLLLALLLASAVLTAQTRKKIVLRTGDIATIEQMRRASPLADIVPVRSEADMMREIVDADGLIGQIRPAEVRAARKLKWVQITSAGVENSLHLSGGNDLRDSNIVLTNNKIVQGPEIADHAFAMLLYLTRDLGPILAGKHISHMGGTEYHGIELNGKTAVVIGVGGIGTEIAVRAAAFGMTVIGVDPEEKPYMPFLRKVVKPDQLDQVLPLADVVFVSAPHTPASDKMIGARQFDLMKQNSYFIASSRGKLFDNDALARVIDSKHLAGAGLDVTDPEPLPANHALRQFPNVVVTPHVGSRSDHSRERMNATIVENIRRFTNGLPLINVVDKRKGY